MGSHVPEERTLNDNIVSGSFELLRSIRDVQYGKKPQSQGRFRWSFSDGGCKPSATSLTTQLGLARVAKSMAAKEAALALRDATPSRDPCPYCGVRGDIGCRHK